MKYSVRYYLNGDKTRFHETEIEVHDNDLIGALSRFFRLNLNATIQKMVKL